MEHGCDLFSMSLGISNSTIAERTLLRQTCVAALDAGVVAAIAAGNEGNQMWQAPIPNNVRVPGSCPPPYMDEVQGENPGDLTCSVCIGAVNYNDAAANFTSRGPVTWTNTEFGDYPYDSFEAACGGVASHLSARAARQGGASRKGRACNDKNRLR